MWVITKHGFISIVQHFDDDTMLRVRARRAEHLIDTFGLDEDMIVDYGEDASDYRYHTTIDRRHVAEALAAEVYDVDYTSHVKEAVTGDDATFYAAMLGCWRELMKLQR